MKKVLFTSVLATAALTLNVSAQRGTLNQGPSPQPSSQAPPPVYSTAPGVPQTSGAVPQHTSPAQPAPAAGSEYVYDQKPAAGRAPLVTQQQAQGIIDKFKAAYPTMGNPRILIYVNRELVDEHTGLKLIARTEKLNTTRTNADDKVANQSEKTSGENRYKLTPKTDPALADKQTVRDVERLFGRPLRTAGATLADQRVASQLITDRNQDRPSTEGDQARKDREALAKIADVAVEILIASKNVTVSDFSGERTFSAPDIQATAIRLKDARILAQASTSDIIGNNPGYYARNYDVREITEATALALMEDMLTGVDIPAAKADSK
jgi:hypothetical protein